MQEAWAATHDVATQLVEAQRTEAQPDMGGARRVTDLAVAAAAAHAVGILRLSRQRRLDGVALRDALLRVALSPLPPLGTAAGVWDHLAQRASETAALIERSASVDAWVAASQAADPGRKSRGAYATPMPFAHRLAASTLRPLMNGPQPVRVVDPSAGAGALLIASLRVLGNGKRGAELRRVVEHLHGVELNLAARELCCLMLWLEAAPARADLTRIAANIASDNAITRAWWNDDGAPYDALLMNPPWESLRHQATEDDPHAGDRRRTIARLSASEPGAPGLPPLYSAQGTGDRNLFKAFVELAPHLVRKGGRIGALIPAAFASDLGMAPLRKCYFDQLALERWTSFENLRGHFPIDSRYKFGLLVGMRCEAGTTALAVRSFATEPDDVDSDHAVITRSDLVQLGGRSLMLPEVKDRQEMHILSRVLEQGTPFFGRGAFGRVVYRREIDLTLGRRERLFSRFEDHEQLTTRADGSFVASDGEVLAPLVEGRMVGPYDFFQKSWMRGRGRTAQWRLNGDQPLNACRPQFVAPPRPTTAARIAICDVTSATNTRTVQATWLPETWPCGNTAPVLLFENIVSARAALAVLNSMVFDWVARHVVGGLHLNKFYLAVLVWPRLTPKAISRLVAASDVLLARSPRFAAAGGRRVLNVVDSSAHAQALTALPLFATVPGAGTLSGRVEPFDREVEGVATTLDEMSARVTVEREVAAGFGLTNDALRHIYDDARTERRGFWRYFAAEPRSREVVRRVLEEEYLEYADADA